MIVRALRHFCGELLVRRHFPPRVLDAIAQAIAAGERTHSGQVCFAVQGGLPVAPLWRGLAPRRCAEEAFARLRVWDTQHNSGVLIHVLLADRAIDIVADRGIAARVGQQEWEAICARMRERFAAAQFEQGAVEGVAAVSALLARHFPAGERGGPNELPDRPVIL